IGDGLEMPLECLITPGFGINESGSQSFDLMQNFLTGCVQRSSKSRIHHLKRGSDGVQTGTDLFPHLIENFHALNAGYRFSTEKIAPAKNIEKIHFIFVQRARNAAFQNGRADSRHDWRYLPAKGLINSARLSEVSDFCRPANIRNGREDG